MPFPSLRSPRGGSLPDPAAGSAAPGAAVGPPDQASTESPAAAAAVTPTGARPAPLTVALDLAQRLHARGSLAGALSEAAADLGPFLGATRTVVLRVFDWRADGVLVQPFAATIEEGIGYYLVYPPERATQPKIRLLREWMLETAQGTRT